MVSVSGTHGPGRSFELILTTYNKVSSVAVRVYMFLPPTKIEYEIKVKYFKLYRIFQIRTRMYRHFIRVEDPFLSF